jgi:hypothetical protein
MKMNHTDPDTSRRIEAARSEFFSTGTQYYISGRYAVIAGLIPVAGNLLHHAVEMFLKGGLASSMELNQLKALGHHLPNTWSAFKSRLGREGFERFDPVVASLHAFEELRYPDSIISRGARMIVGVSGQPALSASDQIIPTPSYELYLSDVDPLVGAIFEVASVNPAFFMAGLRGQAREYLRDANANVWAG